MRRMLVTTMVLASSVVGLTWAGSGAGASGRSTSTSTSTSAELVYVANADSGPVTAYPATAHGPTSPVATLADPRTAGTVWDPWDVAVGPSSTLLVQTFLSDASTFVFPGPSSAPSRIFRAQGPDSDGLAVDTAGYEYVMGGQGPPVISVAGPGAAGQPGDLYTVHPIRQLTTDQTGFHPWPGVLAVDPADEVLAAVTRSSGNAVEVFAGGSSGPSSPVRTIAGPDTGLGTCTSFANCDHVSLSFSTRTGRIYAAVSSGSGARIEVFADTATGDARPLHTITGIATGLTRRVVTGIAESRHTGAVYVLVKSSQFQRPARIEVFGPHASGNVAPLRSFTDAASGLSDAQGIAVEG